MSELVHNVTIVFVSYRSKKKILKYVEKIFLNFKVIIIENSDDKSIINENVNKNCKIHFVNNLGYGSSINYARKHVETEYFVVINPDIQGIDESGIKKFYEVAKKLNNDFSCLGPRYTNISSKTLKQSNKNKEIDTLKSISGAMMFFNIKKFDLLNGFDENFFLYFEETDFSYRGNSIGLKAYQVNSIALEHIVGTSVDFKDIEEEKKIRDLYTWHFIWSKFYFFKKHYGLFLTYMYFLPILLRSVVKFLFFYLMFNHKRKKKYWIRLSGLLSSIRGLKSFKRI